MNELWYSCYIPLVGGSAEIVTVGRDGYLISSYEIDKVAGKL